MTASQETPTTLDSPSVVPSVVGPQRADGVGDTPDLPAPSAFPPDPPTSRPTPTCRDAPREGRDAAPNSDPRSGVDHWGRGTVTGRVSELATAAPAWLPAPYQWVLHHVLAGSWVHGQGAEALTGTWCGATAAAHASARGGPAQWSHWPHCQDCQRRVERVSG